MALTENPKLAMIPSAYKSGKVYSVLPSDGSADLNFARASEATRVNQNGLIETVGSNVPRIDYPLIDGVVQGCPSLLLEPQRSNLVTYSEDFTDASWIKLGAGVGSQAVVTQNYSISPNGTQNATRLQCNLNGGTTASDQSLIYFIPSGSSNSYTNSIYVKGVSGQTFAIGRDLNNNKTVLTDGSWQRVDFTYVNTPIIFIGSRGTTGSDNVLDLEIWGAQLEQGSYATSYIPTSGATATRIAETLSKTGLSNFINSSEGVLYFETKTLIETNVANRTISLTDGTSSNGIEFIYFNSLNAIRISIVSGGTLQFEFPTLTNQNQFKKIALVWNGIYFKCFVDGTQLGNTLTSASPIGLDTLNLGDEVNASPFYGKVKDLRVYNQALTDTELIALTQV